MSAGALDLVLALFAVAVVGGVVFGAVDLLRQPGWAWRAAGEPKILSLALVVLLPGVGLAIYVFGARPKVVEVASAGRAANLPFERFGDRSTLATESTRSIQALARPTTFGSFGERRTRHTVKASGPDITAVAPTPTGFFDDPDLVTVAGPAVAVATTPAGGPVGEPMAATAAGGVAAEPTVPRVPGSLGRPYRPRQRASFDEDEVSLATVAAQILGATQDEDDRARPRQAVTPVREASTVPSFGAPARVPDAVPPLEAAPVAQVAGPTFAGAAPVHGFGHRTAVHASTGRGTATQLLAAPVATPGTPEIFRPPPEAVAPLAAAPRPAPNRPTLAARWLPDPTGRHQYRYWDGGSWTENVYDAGVESRDAVTS